MNVAIDYRNMISEVEVLNNIIEKMSSDDDFIAKIISSDNISQTLNSYGFSITGVILDNFVQTVSKIKISMAKEIGVLSDKIMETVSRVSSGNGTGGW